jgi:hypothetical protein
MFCCPRCSHLSQYCWVWIGCNNIVQCCWQLWTMWAAKHCSILFSSILQQPERFYACIWIQFQSASRVTEGWVAKAYSSIKNPVLLFMLWMWGIIKIHVGICFIDIQCLPGAKLKKYLQEETALQRLTSYDVWVTTSLLQFVCLYTY